MGQNSDRLILFENTVSLCLLSEIEYNKFFMVLGSVKVKVNSIDKRFSCNKIQL